MTKAPTIQIDSKVRLIGVPGNLPNPPDLPTRDIFERCLGKEFVVIGFNELGMAELDVAHVTGHRGECIWVEIGFLEVVTE